MTNQSPGPELSPEYQNSNKTDNYHDAITAACNHICFIRYR